MRLSAIACILLLSFLSQPLLAAAHPAQKVVKNTADRVLERLRADKDQLTENPDQIYSLVHELIIPHFDFNSMSKWVLGRNWRGASEEQRQRFTAEFQTLLVRTYAKALLEYSDEDIAYMPVNEKSGSDLVTVRTEVKQSGSQSIPINYTMHPTDDDWKVVDVSVNGVSLVSTYRGSFASEVRRSGMDSLIQKLTERNAKSKTEEVPGVD